MWRCCSFCPTSANAYWRRSLLSCILFFICVRLWLRRGVKKKKKSWNKLCRSLCSLSWFTLTKGTLTLGQVALFHAEAGLSLLPRVRVRVKVRWPELAWIQPQLGLSTVTSCTNIIPCSTVASWEHDFTDYFVAYFVLFWSKMALWHSWISWYMQGIPVHVLVHEQLYCAEAHLLQPCQGQGSVLYLSRVCSNHTCQTNDFGGQTCLGTVWIA